MATIRERTMPSGERAWIVTFLDNAGKRKTKNFAWAQHGGQKKAKKKAEMFLAQATVDVRDDVYVHAPENPTLADAAPIWFKRLAQREAAGELEKATRVDWESKMRLHVLNDAYGIGSTKVGLLKWGRIEAFRLAMIAAKAPGREVNNTPANARKVLGVLRAFMGWAIDEGLAKSNPFDGRKAARTSRRADDDKALNVPSHDEMKAIFAAADARDTKAKASRRKPSAAGKEPRARQEYVALAIRFAALTGLRAGEQWGLDWPAVDLQAAVVTVHQRQDRYGIIGDPKSAAGNRGVPIPPGLLRGLKELHLSQGRPEEGPVFRTAEGERINHDNWQKRHWLPVLKAAKVQGVRWHDLRHYACSCWFEAGAKPKVVQKRIGHADIAITMRVYAHVLSRDTGEDMARIEAMLAVADAT